MSTDSSLICSSLATKGGERGGGGEEKGRRGGKGEKKKGK